MQHNPNHKRNLSFIYLFEGWLLSNYKNNTNIAHNSVFRIINTRAAFEMISKFVSSHGTAEESSLHCKLASDVGNSSCD